MKAHLNVIGIVTADMKGSLDFIDCWGSMPQSSRQRKTTFSAILETGLR